MKNEFKAPITIPSKVNKLSEKLVQMYLNDEVRNENIRELLDLFKTEKINKPYIEEKTGAELKSFFNFMISHIENIDSERRIELTTIFTKYSQNDPFLIHGDGYIEYSETV